MRYRRIQTHAAPNSARPSKLTTRVCEPVYVCVYVASPGVSGSGSTARLLSEIIGVSSGGPSGRRAGEAGHSYYHYCSFLDLVTKMLHYE
jgi:hypothetical protein